MKQWVPLLVGLGLMAFTAPQPSSEAVSSEVTVTGKLIDTKCYGMNHANHTNDHAGPMKDGKPTTLTNCATACASMGIPVGVLEGGKPDGKVYVLVTPAGALANHQAKEARVTGTAVYAGGIIPTKVEVKDGGKWVDVTPAGMM